jgi:hypothetical protein
VRAEVEVYRKVLEPVPVVVWVTAGVRVKAGGSALEQVRKFHTDLNTNRQRYTSLSEWS